MFGDMSMHILTFLFNLFFDMFRSAIRPSPGHVSDIFGRGSEFRCYNVCAPCNFTVAGGRGARASQASENHVQFHFVINGCEFSLRFAKPHPPIAEIKIQ